MEQKKAASSISVKAAAADTSAGPL